MSNIHASCSGGDGPDLARYPALAYAPSQWGPYIVCASNGTPVQAVARAVARFPEGTSLAEIAADLGIAIPEALDALRYVADQH